MKFILGAAALALTLASTGAQEPDPSPTGEAAPTVASPSPATAVSAPAETSPSPEPPPVDRAKINEEINLADTPGTDDFTIVPPSDEPGAENAPEVTGKLEGDEETTPRPAVTGTIEVSAKDRDQTVRAAVGNLVRITLESNPSTGYNWELRDFEFGVAVFHSGDLVARDNAGNVLFGAPGDTVITLQAVKPGRQDIKLVYRRQWEPPDQVAETFQFQLEVAGDPADSSAPPAATPVP
jgi:inhibitor of cysteine peptidase